MSEKSDFGLRYKVYGQIDPEVSVALWKPRFYLGTLGIIQGDPGTNKSTVLCDIAARVSSGTPFPDTPNIPNPQGNVLLLTAEDGAADTIRPRLDAAGADVNHVFNISASYDIVERTGEEYVRSFDLSRDITRLEKTILEVGHVRMIGIDPLSCYMGSNTDSHRHGSVTGVLEPLCDLAARHRIAVICVAHLNKKSSETNPLYRGSGSLGFTATARTVWQLDRDSAVPTRRMFSFVKNNKSENQNGLTLTVKTTDDGNACYLEWDKEPLTRTAADIFQSEKPGDPIEQAAGWMRAYLTGGITRAAEDVYTAGKKAGFTKYALTQAKDRLCIKPVKSGYQGVYTWTLPTGVTTSLDSEPETGVPTTPPNNV